MDTAVAVHHFDWDYMISITRACTPQRFHMFICVLKQGT